jgi:predicted dehydrogenase
VTPTRILLLGTGAMAERHAELFSEIEGCRVVAGVDIDAGRLAAFCSQFGISQQFTDLDAAIAWAGFDAVSNVTPDSVHHPTTMKLVETGKPIFCEKPLAPNYRLSLEMAEAVESRGIVNMVNLRYRGLAVIQKARALVESGALGAVRHIDAAYLQSWLVGTHWGDWRIEPRWLWRLSEAHGSRGVLGDLGIHILDLASFVADQDFVSVHCRLRSFAKAAGNRVGDYALDANDSFVLSLEMDGGALATVHASRWATGYANAQKLAVFGTEGALEIWFESEESGLRACLGEDVHTQTWREVECPPVPNTYRTFIDAVRGVAHADPNFRRATELQHVIDLCFDSHESGGAVAISGPQAPKADRLPRMSEHP